MNNVKKKIVTLLLMMTVSFLSSWLFAKTSATGFKKDYNKHEVQDVNSEFIALQEQELADDSFESDDEDDLFSQEPEDEYLDKVQREVYKVNIGDTFFLPYMES